VLEGTVVQAAPATLPAYVLSAATEEVTVTLFKEAATTRIGIGLSPEEPDRAVVNTVAAETPAAMPVTPGSAATLIEPYDELLEIGGVRPESAVHAVKLIREAPAGDLIIRKLRCPDAAKRAAVFAQASWRAKWPKMEGLTRRLLVKPTATTVLGLAFSPDYNVHSVIKAIKEGGAAHGLLAAGDRIVASFGDLGAVELSFTP